MTISSMVSNSAALYEVMNSMQGSVTISSSAESAESTEETATEYETSSLTATEELYDIDGDGELSTQEEAKMERALEAKKAAREQLSSKMQNESDRISSKISAKAADQEQSGSAAVLRQKVTEQYARQQSPIDDWNVVNYAV